jgi:hypothetical protein
MSLHEPTAARLAGSVLFGLLLSSCSGATNSDDATRLSETADDDAGFGDSADDDGATSDDATGAADDGAHDIVGDNDAPEPSDDLIPGDDDTSGGEVDASAPNPEEPVSDVPVPDVPDGFVSIEETDGGFLEILCGSEPCACSDAEDNDGDGLVDGADSECTGPFDNDEGTFATGIPGDNRDPKWQDCFFDGNSGAGDDGCRYHTDCLTGDAEPGASSCSVSDQCRDYCAPLTPPGCDCFGCCEIPLDDGGSVFVLASEQCSLDNIDDEDACPRCERTDECGNECGECEICLGETLEDLPETCFDDPPDGSAGAGGGDGAGGEGTSGSAGNGGSSASGGSGNSGGGPPDDDPPPNECDGGARSCLVSEDCGSGQYCSLGCCKDYPSR